MWSGRKASPKSFFNYCKLAVINGGGGLADEVNAAEGLTRFFAGTVVALRMSIWMLVAVLIAQLGFAVVLTVRSQLGIKSAFSVQLAFHGFHFLLNLAIVLALQWVRRRIINRFRYVRLSEAGTVYHAFYLHSKSHGDESTKGEPTVSRKTFSERLKSLFMG